MLEMYYTQSKLFLLAAAQRLTVRSRAERGLSDTVQNALLVVAGVAAVALLVAAVTTLLTSKAAIIAGS